MCILVLEVEDAILEKKKLCWYISNIHIEFILVFFISFQLFHDKNNVCVTFQNISKINYSFLCLFIIFQFHFDFNRNGKSDCSIKNGTKMRRTKCDTKKKQKKSVYKLLNGSMGLRVHKYTHTQMQKITLGGNS